MERYTVRNAVLDDMTRILSIYAYARQFMEDTGNPNQWGKTNPPESQLLEDIVEGHLYVIESDGIHGVFFLGFDPDSTYATIYDGSWLSDTPYATIHRIAGDGAGGIVGTAVAFAKEKTSHLRIDTHEDNKVMQHVVEKHGFIRRGIIHLANGDPRIAYEMV